MTSLKPMVASSRLHIARAASAGFGGFSGFARSAATRRRPLGDDRLRPSTAASAGEHISLLIDDARAPLAPNTWDTRAPVRVDESRPEPKREIDEGLLGRTAGSVDPGRGKQAKIGGGEGRGRVLRDEMDIETDERGERDGSHL